MNVHRTGYRVDESIPFLWPEYLIHAGTRDPGQANQSQSQDSAGAMGKEALFFLGSQSWKHISTQGGVPLSSCGNSWMRMRLTQSQETGKRFMKRLFECLDLIALMVK